MRMLVTSTPARVGPAHETWPCPVCRRPVEIVTTSGPLRMHGYWLPPSRAEVIAVCAQQHHAHRRDGRAIQAPEPVDEGRRWRPVVWGVGTEGPQPFIVLVPPAGTALVPDGTGAFDVVLLRRLEPSDLVGSWDRLLASGEHDGKVAGDDVRIDRTGQCIDWDHFTVAPRL
jgi:hypothetical protein